MEREKENPMDKSALESLFSRKHELSSAKRTLEVLVILLEKKMWPEGDDEQKMLAEIKKVCGVLTSEETLVREEIVRLRNSLAP